MIKKRLADGKDRRVEIAGMVEERLVYGETGIEEIVGLVEGRLVGVWIVWYRSDWCMDSMVKKRLVYG